MLEDQDRSEFDILFQWKAKAQRQNHSSHEWGQRRQWCVSWRILSSSWPSRGFSTVKGLTVKWDNILLEKFTYQVDKSSLWFWTIISIKPCGKYSGRTKPRQSRTLYWPPEKGLHELHNTIKRSMEFRYFEDIELVGYDDGISKWGWQILEFNSY